MVRQRNLVQDKTQERCFWHPVAVAITDDTKILCLESNRHRIQVYRKENS